MLTQPAPPVREASRPLPPLLVLVPGDRELGRPLHARQHDLQELTDLRHRGSDALFPPGHTGLTSGTPAPAAPTYVVVPASVAGDLVVIEPQLPLGQLEVLLNRPGQAPDSGQRG